MMSRWREAAQTLREVAAARRRNWNPAPGSVHYRIYRWWLRQSGAYIAQENFCHYWRIVFVWAPLRWLVKPLLVGLAVVATLLLVLVVIRFGLSIAEVVIGMAALSLGFLYLILGIMVGGKIAVALGAKFVKVDWDEYDDLSSRAKALFILLALPVLLTAGVVLAILLAAMAGVMYLHKKHNLFSRIGWWSVDTHWSKSKWLSWVRPWLAGPLAILVLSWWFVVARVVLVVLMVIAVIFAVAVLLSYLADHYESRQAEKGSALREALRRQAPSPVPAAYVPVRLRWARTRRFLRGARELLALMWAWMVAKKMGICPLVELPVGLTEAPTE